MSIKSVFLVGSIFLGLFAPGQDVVTIGRPTIKSLEQAHYLLAQMREKNRALKVTSLTEINPNKINAFDAQSVRNQFGASLGVDKVTALKNQLLLEDFTQERQRRRSLMGLLGPSYEAYAQTLTDISNLEREIALLEQRVSQPDRRSTLNQSQLDELTEELAQKMAEKTDLGNKIDSYKAELDLLNASLAEVNTANPSDFESGFSPPDGVLQSPLTLPPNNTIDPQLNASTQLDNHINMQYEIIAKQLSLLRDEVGPGQRLLFLELPQTIRHAKKKRVVEFKWNVTRFWTDKPQEKFRRITKQIIPLGKDSTAEDIDATIDSYLASKLGAEKGYLREALKETSGDLAVRGTFANIDQVFADLETPGVSNNVNGALDKIRKYRDDIRKRWNARIPIPLSESEILELLASGDYQEQDNLGKKKAIRTIDIIPRQSKDNVLKVRQQQTFLGLQALFLNLGGLGGKVAYQRQKERYRQYADMEQYATGFGKGELNFGWLFGPVFGRKTIAPGTKTTYAILVVPEDTIGLELFAEAFTYRSKKYPREGTRVKHEKFVYFLERPSQGFYVTEIDYSPVPVGDQTTLYIGGQDFSPQLGVLINGLPLRKEVNLAARGEDVGNAFELINSRRLVATFRLPGFAGTPEITLITPQKSVAINGFNDVFINNIFGETMNQLAASNPMFLESPKVTEVRILEEEGVNPKESYTATVQIEGTDFRAGNQFFINGVPLDSPTIPTSRHSWDTFTGSAPFLNADTWQVMVRVGDQGLSDSKSFANPLKPRVTAHDYLRYGTEDNGNRLVLHLKGSGFTAHTRVHTIDDDGGRVPADVLSSSQNQITVSATADKDPLLLLVANAGGAVSQVYPVKRPQPPTITSFSPAEEEAEKEAEITIKGQLFGHVTKVFFGNIEADITRNRSETHLVVKVKQPKLKKPKTVRVTLSTDFLYLGRYLSNSDDTTNAQYTFKPKPTTKKDDKS